jgi:hypothetical protein
MSVEVQWTDTDPNTGERRWVSVTRFAQVWQFKTRAKRRDDWKRTTRITRDMWETLLDALERRYRRREGVREEDLDDVRRRLLALPEDDDREAVDPA